MKTEKKSSTGVAIACAIAFAATVTSAHGATGSCSPNQLGVVISQVYGGGGAVGSPYKNDFIELHNIGTVDVSLAGYAVQYQAASAMTWSVVALPATSIKAGGYFLIQGAAGGAGAALPAPDATSGINLNATAGKVALTKTTAALTVACPLGAAAIVDFVGYGAVACADGTSPAPAPSNTMAIMRAKGGADTNNNGADFPLAAPMPRNKLYLPLQLAECTLNGTGVAAEMDYCAVTSPATIAVTVGTQTAPIYARVAESGLTEPAGPSPQIIGQIGYGADNLDPSKQSGFTWFPVIYNTQASNMDEYKATVTAPTAAGTYRYAARFSQDGINWTYCDVDGAGSSGGAFAPAQLGTMTVTQ